jgi:hypothetical protein
MGSLPQFFIAGAPKAGTTALHLALTTHPDLYLSPVKEPKYFLCAGVPPVAGAGPGDAHSAKEWIWRRDLYEGLFDPAPPGALRGESTPFYLYDPAAQQRIRDLVPDARIIVVVRDPVDRAHSNWMHLWSDGLEPIGDFAAACRAEPARMAAGWAPFWAYRGLGRYGRQLEHLYGLFPAGQVHLLRYRELVGHPARTLDRICVFLGVRTGICLAAPAENVRPFVPPSRRTATLATLLRGGAAVGSHLPPQVWRQASRPLLAALHRGGAARPALTVEARREVLGDLVDDIRLLERATGQSFSDWLGDEGRGEFRARQGAD